MSLVVVEERRDVLTPLPYSFDIDEQHNYLDELFSSLDSPIDYSYPYIKEFRSKSLDLNNPTKNVLKREMSSSLEVNSSGSSPYSTSPLSPPKKHKSQSLDMASEEPKPQHQPRSYNWGHLDCEQNASIAVERIPLTFQPTSNETSQFLNAHHPRSQFVTFASNSGPMHGFPEHHQAPVMFNFNSFTNINVVPNVSANTVGRTRNMTEPSIAVSSNVLGHLDVNTRRSSGQSVPSNPASKTRDSRDSDAEFCRTLGLGHDYGHRHAQKQGNGSNHNHAFTSTIRPESHVNNDAQHSDTSAPCTHDITESGGNTPQHVVDSHFLEKQATDEVTGCLQQNHDLGVLSPPRNESSAHSTGAIYRRGRGERSRSRCRDVSRLKQRRVKWSDLDIFTLWTSIEAKGNEWTEVGSCLPSRTYHQVKDKGRRMLQENNWQTGRTKHDTEIAGESAKEIAAKNVKEMLQINPSLKQEYLNATK